MAKIDLLFDDLVKRGGSDLHLGVGHPPLARVRGDLVALRDGTLDAKDLEDVLTEILTPAQRASLDVSLDLDFAHAHRDVARFRASYFIKSGGLGAVFRLVPSRVLTLAELGCPEVLWKLADRRSGLVLVTGPSSCGKSTTVAAMLDHINKTRACHILTIEDPIEFVHEPLRAHITQREVRSHVPCAVAALRNAARENPDVIFASELRTNDALELALDLATRGILVVVTMRTNGAVATIDRIVGAFPPEEQAHVRSLLADTLAGVVSQQLVRTTDGKGGIPVHEVFVATAPGAQLVRENKTGQLLSVMQAGQSQGMQTMDMALERLLTQSRITAELALDRAVDKESFARVVARVRPDLAESLG
ncbi:MAG: PilT/PilU family type 4a pilus ATPase [Labilithrix sp.]|nr:PilT/PilU family type 4a pilus ATPase [Labilithrix sp.]